MKFMDIRHDDVYSLHFELFFKLRENEVWVARGNYDKEGVECRSHNVEEVLEIEYNEGDVERTIISTLLENNAKPMDIDDFIMVFKMYEGKGEHLYELINVIDKEMILENEDDLGTNYFFYHYLNMSTNSDMYNNFYERCVDIFGYDYMANIFTTTLRDVEFNNERVQLKLLYSNFNKYADKIIVKNPNILTSFISDKVNKFLIENMYKINFEDFEFETLKLILKKYKMDLDFQERCVKKDIRLMDFCSDRYTEKMIEIFKNKLSNLN